jgi:HlyD family secretion protein
MKGIVILLALAGLGVFGWRFYAGGLTTARADGVAAEALFTTRRGDLDITVVENGYLKAKNSINIQPQFRGEAKITWLVEEGKTVEKDEKLAEFDATETQHQLDELENQLITYRTELDSARAQLEIEKRDSTASVEAAQFNLDLVRLKLERYLNGDGPNELRKVSLAAEKARSEFDRAAERFRQVPDLAKEGFMTKNAEEEERIKLRETEIGKESAEKELELYLKYTDPMERRQLEANVKDAERVLKNASEKAEISTKERETRVSQSESQVRQAEQRLGKLKEEIGFMVVKAPQPGVIHYGDPARPWNRDEVKVGNDFYRGNTLFTLPDLREMQVLINVHEADIDLVKLEQVVHVTVEAVKGRTLNGKVTRIAQVANSDWTESANKTFQTEITMEPLTDLELRSGITAHVEIQVEQLKGVIYVPIHAIVSENGEQFCFVPQGPSFDRRVVKLGKNNLHYVEITDGLAEGDKVLLYDPRETSASEREGAAEKPKGGSESLAPAGTSPNGVTQ